MIGFVTLFLGLALGSQTVEVQVDETVAAVELVLDGRSVAWIHGPPWIGTLSLGEQLSPHRLEAVAYDDEGQETGRAEQWINLPRPPAEASILLDQKVDGVHRIARVSWESLVETEPSDIRVTFDGAPLGFTDPQAIPLPDHDPEQLHFIRVDLEFGDMVTSKAELIFGGAYADEVSTELTAVPVLVEAKSDLPPVAEMRSWFRYDGEPLRAAAAEKGLAEIIVVRDLGAWSDLTRIRRSAATDRNKRAWWFSSPQSAWSEWAFQFFWPIPRRQTGAAGMYDLFPPSGKFRAKDGSLHGWMSTVAHPDSALDRQRLADCVGVAGVTAAGGNRRRAVVLLLGGEPQDASDLSPALARRYLAQLHVPLIVWTTRPGPAVESSGWGDTVDVSTDMKIAQATRELFKMVERQRMVWLDGIHLLQHVELNPELEGVELVTTTTGSG